MAATLNTRLRLPSGAMLLAVDDLRGVESRLRQASGRLQEGRSALRRIADKIGELSPAALKTAASVLVDRSLFSIHGDFSDVGSFCRLHIA